MVFQSYALYPHMSVRGNIAFGLKMAGLPRPEIERKVEAAAATLNLTPYLDRKPRELSGGQRQRVAIGRAIVRAPKAFLFDRRSVLFEAACVPHDDLGGHRHGLDLVVRDLACRRAELLSHPGA